MGQKGITRQLSKRLISPDRLEDGPKAHFAGFKRVSLSEMKRTPSTDSEIQDELDSEMMRLPITSLLAGSERFRRMLANLRIDMDLCSLLDSKLAEFYTENELAFLLPCKVKKFKEGDLLLDSTANPMRYCFVLMCGECSIVSKDSEVAFVNKFLRDGTVFGGLSHLREQRKPTPFEVKAVTEVDALLVSLDQLKSLTSFDQTKAKALAAYMAEAPDEPGALQVARSTSAAVFDAATVDPSERLQQSQSVSELQRRALKEFVVQMDQLWADVSLGSNTVFRKQLYWIKKMMGEASSELFHTIFLAKVPLPHLPSLLSQCLVLTPVLWLSAAAAHHRRQGDGKVCNPRCVLSSTDVVDIAASFSGNATLTFSARRCMVSARKEVIDQSLAVLFARADMASAASCWRRECRRSRFGPRGFATGGEKSGSG